MPAARLGPLALSMLAVALLSPPPALAADAPPKPDAKAWLLIDATDREVLLEHRASERLPVASTTKLMTAYVTLSKVRPGTVVRAPAYQAMPGESLLGLRQGERVSVRELLYALIVASANDAAVALADAVAGSNEEFVAEMNRYAAALGLEDTHYANPIGLDAADNRSSARDLATLALRLRQIPIFRRIADTERIAIRTGRRTRKLETHNDLLTEVPWVNGVKTGYTLDAGFVLVASGTRKGVTLVSVVLGTTSQAIRDGATRALLDHGFSLYRPRNAVARGERLASPEIDSGGTVRLVAARPITVSVRKGQRVKTEVRAPKELEGPIERGERLGRVTVIVDGRAIAGAPLVAARAAPAASLTDEVADGLSLPAVGAAGAAVVILIAGTLWRRARRA